MELLDRVKKYGDMFLREKEAAVPLIVFETFGGEVGTQVIITDPSFTIHEQHLATMIAADELAPQFSKMLEEQGKPPLKEMGNDAHLRRATLLSYAWWRKMSSDAPTPSHLAGDPKAKPVIIGVEMLVPGDEPIVWDAKGQLDQSKTEFKAIALPIIMVGGVEDLGGPMELENPDPDQLLMFFTGWLNYLMPSKECNAVLEIIKLVFSSATSKV